MDDERRDAWAKDVSELLRIEKGRGIQLVERRQLDAATTRRLPRLICEHLATWGGAVVEQQDRILTRDSRSYGSYADFARLVEGDAFLYVTALRNLERAAALAALVFESEELKAACEVFRKAVPDLKTLRDVIEHFDDYQLNKGRLTSVVVQEIAMDFDGDDTRVWVWHKPLSIHWKRTDGPSQSSFRIGVEGVGTIELPGATESGTLLRRQVEGYVEAHLDEWLQHHPDASPRLLREHISEKSD